MAVTIRTERLWGEPTQEAIINERQWEGDNITAGVERYRRGLYNIKHTEDGGIHQTPTSLADTQAGLNLTRDLVARLIPHIEEVRQLCIASLSSRGAGRPPVWMWYIPLLTADKLAVIVVRSVLSVQDSKGLQTSSTATAVARCIGYAMRDQLEYEAWIKDSAASASEGDTIDLAAVLVAQRKGNVDRKTFSRWKRKCADIKRLNWSVEDVVNTGMTLIHTAVNNSDGQIELRSLYKLRKTWNVVGLSEDAQGIIDKAHRRLELHRPYLLPTIIPPQPWSIEDDE